MRRRIFVGAALLAVVAVLAGGGTASAGKPVNGCPDSYQPISATVDPIVDKNADGTICTKQIGGPPGTTIFSDIDDLAANH